MAILSNSYIEKVLSEHPLAAWMLNDDVGYISLLSESTRQLSNATYWTISGGTISTYTPKPNDTPFPNSYVNSFSVSSAPATAQLLYNSSFSSNAFNLSETSVAMSFYLKLNDSFVQQVSYGFQYTDGLGATAYSLQTETLTSNEFNVWTFFSNTFDLPATFSNLKPIIRITSVSGGSSYNVFINGLTFGQWSENFNSYDLGVSVADIPASISLPSTLKTYPVGRYGSNNNYGYYLATGSKLFAKNFGTPLAFGSTNISSLYENKISGINYPSVIFPGYGFLNERGRHNTYTAEMWLSVDSSSLESKKIFGPISGTDGLYVDGPFLTLSVNNQYKSFYVGEWMRPMLVHVLYGDGRAEVILNGEKIISIDINRDTITLASEFQDAEKTKNQNWLGFFAYSNVEILLDSFVIYSYLVPIEVAKRRFVWGQGVIAPELAKASVGSNTVFADYSYAKYSNNYNYPDFAKWGNGYFNNLDISQNAIKMPDYSLPEFYLGDFSESEWFSALKTLETSAAEKYFTFRPDTPWASTKGYIYFNNLNVIQDKVESIYLSFQTSQIPSSNQTILKITKKNSQDYLRVFRMLDSQATNNIKCEVFFDGVLTTIFTKSTIAERFSLLLNLSTLSKIEKIGDNKISGASQFFSNPSLLSMYVGGDLESTFPEKIYSIGFNSKFRSQNFEEAISQISGYSDYTSLGVAYMTQTNSEISGYSGSYLLKPYEKYGSFFADIAAFGYWQNQIPLSYFATYVKKWDGDEEYDLDFLQINMDAVEPIDTITESQKTYASLQSQYEYPVIKYYSDLSSDWASYTSLANDGTQITTFYDISGYPVKIYASFQYTKKGANKVINDFTNIIKPLSSGVLDTTALTYDWQDSVYGIVDGSIVYPPKKRVLLINNQEVIKNVDFNDLSIVVHMEFTIDGLLHKPLYFRDLQISAKTLEKTEFSEIGTRYGIPVYPYGKTGIYYDFGAKNPISLYKESTPHLYLTKHSGWRMRGEFQSAIDRGMSIPINTQKNSNVQIAALQMWVRLPQEDISITEQSIFSIKARTQNYNFYMIADSNLLRSKIIGRNADTGQLLTSVEYFINGHKTQDPYIKHGEWTTIGLSFATEVIDFGLYSGRIDLSGPMTYNNISYYFATSLEQQQSLQVRPWSDISSGGKLWNSTPLPYSGTWKNVYVVSSSSVYTINPEQIYAKYVGADRLVIDDEISTLSMIPISFAINNDIRWSDFVKTAV